MTYRKKPRYGFYCNRPYGMRIDYAQKGICSFQPLCQYAWQTEKPAPLKNFPWRVLKMSNEIPLNGIFVQNGNHTTDVYFYSEESNPYRNATLDLEALKQYNRFIYPLSILLNRTL